MFYKHASNLRKATCRATAIALKSSTTRDSAQLARAAVRIARDGDELIHAVKHLAARRNAQWDGAHGLPAYAKWQTRSQRNALELVADQILIQDRKLGKAKRHAGTHVGQCFAKGT